jgi:hypothetical protein
LRKYHIAGLSMILPNVHRPRQAVEPRLRWVWGCFVDLSNAACNLSECHCALPTSTLGSVSQNWIGTIAGRVGLVEDNWLLYGKLGGGWVQSNASLNFPGVTWQGANTNPGWLAGVGVEYGFKPSGQQWTVPIGGGFGRIFKMGDQPVSANIAAYYNVVRPTGVPNLQLRAELSLLFPER